MQKLITAARAAERALRTSPHPDHRHYADALAEALPDTCAMCSSPPAEGAALCDECNDET